MADDDKCADCRLTEDTICLRDSYVMVSLEALVIAIIHISSPRENSVLEVVELLDLT